MRDPIRAKITRVRVWLDPDPRCAEVSEVELRDAIRTLLHEFDHRGEQIEALIDGSTRLATDYRRAAERDAQTIAELRAELALTPGPDETP